MFDLLDYHMQFFVIDSEDISQDRFTCGERYPFDSYGPHTHHHCKLSLPHRWRAYTPKLAEEILTTTTLNELYNDAWNSNIIME